MQPEKEKLKEVIVALLEKESIGEVAELVGVSTQALRDIRSGRSAVTLDTLLGFAKAYLDRFGPAIEEVFGVKPAQGTVESNVDYKLLYEDERKERIRITKVNERLAISMLEKAGLLTDQEGSKIESSSWATVREVMHNQQQDQTDLQTVEREQIGYKPKYTQRMGKVNLFPNVKGCQITA